MKWRILVAIVGALLSFGLAASPAGAQAARTWVSSSGSDLNPCTRRLPCLTFALALIRTIDGGEINCVDPGGFGPVLVITKSVTIDCGGMFGSAFASGTTGFTIDDSRTTAPQSITVTLRNLSINGGTVMSPGVNGIRFISGRRLNVENVTIFNFASPGQNTGFGIMVTNAVGNARIHVANSVIRNNGTTSSGGGIGFASTGTGSVQLSLENVQLTGNYRGIDAALTGTTGNSSLTFVNGRIFGSAQNAVTVATNANLMLLHILNVTINNNGNGIITSGSGSATRIGRSTVAANGTAFRVTSGAVIQSYGNNEIGFNGDDGTPLPPVPLN